MAGRENFMRQRNVAHIRSTGSIIGRYLLWRHNIELPIWPKTDLSRTLIGENGAKVPEGIRQFAAGNLRITCHTRYPRQTLDDLLSHPDVSLTNAGSGCLWRAQIGRQALQHKECLAPSPSNSTPIAGRELLGLCSGFTAPKYPCGTGRCLDPGNPGWFKG